MVLATSLGVAGWGVGKVRDSRQLPSWSNLPILIAVPPKSNTYDCFHHRAFLVTLGIARFIITLFGGFLALLDLVGKMYSKIHSS
jgi:hypothetical protein